jgi:hypothetical protein
LQAELGSLGIECKQTNELNDKEESQTLATAIKDVSFQDYKSVHDYNHTKIDEPHFDYII